MASDGYYTPCNVGIYIGGYKISDAFRVDWDCRDSKTPLYGWADDKYRAITKGRKITTGRIVINYTHPDYLTNAINRHYLVLNNEKIESSIKSPESIEAGYNYAEEENMMAYLEKSGTERVKFLADLASKNYGHLNYIVKKDRIMSKLALGLAGSSHYEYWDYENHGHLKQLWSHVKNNQPYESERTFDILVTYGDSMTENHIETIIKDAYIVGQSQAISASATGGGDVSSSGSPIYEIYSFFAKEIVAKKVPARNMDNKPEAKTDDADA